ncbi:MAG: sulfatase [Planctomycetes bacterium]|nr:sulfatase [Planctomycetota bacterium]
MTLRFVRIAAVAIAFLASGCSRKPKAPPNLIVLTVDTERRDHLDLYGYHRETAPHLRALAREGVTFTNAVTPIPKTAPALASLHTGRYPKFHGVRHNLSDVLPDNARALAQVLSEHGYETAAFVSNWVLSRSIEVPASFDRGFRTYEDRLTKPEAKRPKILEQPAEPLTDSVLSWLAATPSEPFFLWVHYMDPHGPYDPPPHYRSLFTSAEPAWIPPYDPARDFASPVFYLTEWNLLDGPDRHDLNLHVDRYDGEIAYADHEIGRVLDALRSRHLDDRTLVVYTADHGESFGEHGVYFEHGLDLYDENVRIPLVVRLPGGIRAGATVSERVQLCDVMPTCLDLLDLPIVDPFDGRTLRGAIEEGRALGPVPVHLETNEGTGLTLEWPKGLLDGDWKCILRLRPGVVANEPNVARTELYDLRADALEKRDLAASEPDRTGRMRDRILDFVRGAPFDERKSRLEAFGYFGSGTPGDSIRTPQARSDDESRMRSLLVELDGPDGRARVDAARALAALPADRVRAAGLDRVLHRLEVENDAANRNDALVLALRDLLFGMFGRDQTLFGSAAPHEPTEPAAVPDTDAVRALLARLRAR